MIDAARMPLALYIHLPWCVRKCPYCDFNSHVHKDALPEAEYVKALLLDFDADLPLAGGRQIETVFFGGGTPSLFAPESIDALLRGLRQRVAFAADAEITLEANPGAIEHGRFSGYYAAGINRISLGAQTFNSATLTALGRIHGPEDTHRAAGELSAAGFSNFNVDWMYALPKQTVAEALFDVACVAQIAPPHVSHYQLTLEPGTVFYTRPPVLPDDDLAEDIQVEAHARLVAHGYHQYEISAWAQQGFECRHNLNYWQFGDYLGIGAGAHGKLSQEHRLVRTVKSKQPREYLRLAESGGELGARAEVPAAARTFEFMLNALRLPEGFTRDLFEARTGLALSTADEPLRLAIERGLMAVDAERFFPTALGLRFLNDLQILFLNEPPF